MDIITIEPNPVSDLLRELSILRHTRKSGLSQDDLRKINYYMIMTYKFLRKSKEHQRYKNSRIHPLNSSCKYDIYLSTLADHYSYFHSVIAEERTVLSFISEDRLSYAIPPNYGLLKGDEIISPRVNPSYKNAYPRKSFTSETL